MFEEDADEVHVRADMNDLVVKANNLNQLKGIDGYASEEESDHDGNKSEVDPGNNDANSVDEDDIA